MTHHFFPILQLYREDDSTGEIVLSLSSDSTCTSGLRSSSDGAETLSLRPRIPRPWPSEVLRPPTESSSDPCRLPRWAQGKWQHLHVSGGSLILRDQRDFKTYTARCVGGAVESGMMSNSIRSRRHHRRHGHHRHHNSEEEEEEQEGRFLIYARTHCGDESYQCLWIKNRGNNALEFQIGKPNTLTISHIFFEGRKKNGYSSSSKIRTHLAFPSPPSGNENYSIRHFPLPFLPSTTHCHFSPSSVCLASPFLLLLLLPPTFAVRKTKNLCKDSSITHPSPLTAVEKKEETRGFLPFSTHVASFPFFLPWPL